MITKEHAETTLGHGEVLVDIGQIGADLQKSLDLAVKRGMIVKWRGYWHPVAGAHFGIGPLKSCYGLPEVGEHFARFKAQMSNGA